MSDILNFILNLLFWAVRTVVTLGIVFLFFSLAVFFLHKIIKRKVESKRSRDHKGLTPSSNSRSTYENRYVAGKSYKNSPTPSTGHSDSYIPTVARYESPTAVSTSYRNRSNIKASPPSNDSFDDSILDNGALEMSYERNRDDEYSWSSYSNSSSRQSSCSSNSSSSGGNSCDNDDADDCNDDFDYSDDYDFDSDDGGCY